MRTAAAVLLAVIVVSLCATEVVRADVFSLSCRVVWTIYASKTGTTRAVAERELTVTIDTNLERGFVRGADWGNEGSVVDLVELSETKIV
jgi:hypothetical protein